MNNLPIELKKIIIDFLPFQNAIHLLLVSKKFWNIITNSFLIPKKRISKYKISRHIDYLILVKFKPHVKTLMIQGHIIDLKKINLKEMDYERLFFKDVKIVINDIKMLDENISQKNTNLW